MIFDLQWYLYFSWWVYIWFLLYKLNIIKYTPFIVYVFILFYAILKSIQQIRLYLKKIYNRTDNKNKNKNKLNDINYEAAISWIAVAFYIDIVPIFFLKRKVNYESLCFAIILSIIYVLFMIYKKLDVIEHYERIDLIELSKRYSANEFFLQMLGIK